MNANKTPHGLSVKQEKKTNIFVHSESSLPTNRQCESTRVLFSSLDMLIYSKNLLFLGVIANAKSL